jgi:hypothetical protein
VASADGVPSSCINVLLSEKGVGVSGVKPTGGEEIDELWSLLYRSSGRVLPGRTLSGRVLSNASEIVAMLGR